MDLVENYVKAVSKALPEEQRADVAAELSEDIRSEIEDREREMGRALTDAEQEAVLRKRGNPLVLAARYRQDQRSVAFGKQIIGPVLYPFYIRVLSFNLGLTLLVIAVIFTALAVSGQKITFSDIASTLWLQLVIQLGAVTVIFWFVEMNLKKNPDRWQMTCSPGGFPLDLKIETRTSKKTKGNVKNVKEISRFDSISILVACGVALAWMTEVKHFPFLILGPAAAFLKLAPVWYQVYLPIAALTAAEMVRASINLVRPDWVRFRAWCGVLIHACGLALVCFLIGACSWVVAASANGQTPADYVRAAAAVNQWFLYGLVAAAALSAAMLVRRVIRLVRQPSAKNGAAGAGAVAGERS